jgi:uncharacterized protein
VNTLDPRSALVLDTHELGRRAGAMFKKSLTVPAPDGIGDDVIGIQAGADIKLELRFESVIEGVLVSGDVIANATGQCSRCLDPIAFDVTVPVQELYENEESENEDDETLKLEGDYLDLEPVVRDALVLSLPLAPLCDEECLGLCSECGIKLSEAPDHQHESVDSRWQALKGLLDEKKEG